jgi:hypothetical protein
MARSKIRRRQEAERQRIEVLEATLRRVNSASRPPPDFEQALKEAKKGFEGEIVRDAWAWRPRLKTRDAARLRLAAARHLFARYTVPAHLEQVWLDSGDLSEDEVSLRKRWYLIAACGGSLYKADASCWLSRKEVHCFLNPPGELSFDEAFWVAIARGFTDDLGLSLRIARSKVARSPRSQLDFWREVARFFCANPAPLETIDDLCDYIAAARRRDARFSLKGRTLASLRHQMEAWHRELAAIQRIEAMQRRAVVHGAVQPQIGSWQGSRLRDWEWKPQAKDAKGRGERFVIRQLNTAQDLVAESAAMHHCVSTYAGKCVAGYASIWAVRRITPDKSERMLTIELDRQDRIVQIRGFANRLARPDEMQIVERWAKASGINLPR